MALSPLCSTGRPVATPWLGSMLPWAWGPWPMTLPDGPILWNLGGGSHASPSPSARLVPVETGQMVITKVCCLCSLEGQPLRLVLHCGLVSWPKSSLIFHGIRKLKWTFWPTQHQSVSAVLGCGTNYRDQSPTCEVAPNRWHQGPKGAGGPFFEKLCSPGPCTQGLWWEWQLSSGSGSLVLSEFLLGMILHCLGE